MCFFSSAYSLHSSWNVSIIAFVLFPRCPSAHFCPPWSSHFPFSLSLSLSSLSFESVGTSNERLPCADWMMYDVIRWDESEYNSKAMKWKRRDGRRKWGSGDSEMFWQAALKTKGRVVLQMHACNNGSRSQIHWCFSPGTLPLGNSPTDLIPGSSASLSHLAL